MTMTLSFARGRVGLAGVTHVFKAYALPAWAALLLSGCAAQEPRTPLPAQVEIVSPGPDIPESVAAFSGIWTGRIETISSGTGSGQILRDQTLVVQRIRQTDNTTYQALILWSVGPFERMPASQATVTGTISPDGVLHVGPLRSGLSSTYKMSADRSSLASESVGPTFVGGTPSTWRGTLWRNRMFPDK